MSDVWDSEPYQLARLQPAPTPAQAAEQGRRLRRLNVISSSGGRIHSPIQADNEFVVRTLLRLGTDVTEENQKGWTPLLHAAFLCHESICQLLLEHGAGVPVPTIPMYQHTEETRSAIKLAVDNYENHVVTLQILLVQAAMEGESLCKELFEDSKLVVALTHIRVISSGNIATQVQRRIDLAGHLHFAITNAGGVKAVELLLAMGPDIDRLDKNGRTPLFYAACRLKEGVCKILLEAGANTQFIRGTAPTIDVVKILQTDEQNGQQPLQTVPELLKIMGASVAGQLHRAIVNGKVAWVSMLIDWGVDIEEPDKQGRTPLLNAACRLQEDICKLLLQAGADIQSIRDTAPTIDVIKVLKTHMNNHPLQTVPQLLKITKARVEGQLHPAILTGNVGWVSTLLDCGADIEERDPSHIARGTPLAHALYQVDESICNVLLARGASTQVLKGQYINFGYGLSTRISIPPGKDGIQNVLQRYPSVTALLQVMDLCGKLHEAIGQKDQRLVRVLLALGASVGAPDREGRTPLVHAAIELQERICEILLEHEASADSRLHRISSALKGCIHGVI